MSDTTHTPAQTSGKRRSGKVRTFLALGSVVGIGAAVTLAQFTDSGEVSATFSTGSVDIAFDGDNQGTPDPYAFEALTLTDAGPGDDVVAPLEVNNIGTLDFTYLFSTDVEDDVDGLADEIELTIVEVESAEACDDAVFEDPEDVVYDGPLSGAATTEDRTLAADDSEFLCYQAVVGEDAPQGAEVTAIFEFIATQS